MVVIRLIGIVVRFIIRIWCKATYRRYGNDSIVIDQRRVQRGTSILKDRTIPHSNV